MINHDKKYKQTPTPTKTDNNMHNEEISKIINTHLEKAYSEIMKGLTGDIDPSQAIKIDQSTEKIVEIMSEVHFQNRFK